MLDWLAIWGVTQAAGFIFKPILEDLAKDAAKDWAKDLLKGIPGKIVQKLKPEDIEIAAGKALKEFLQLMQQQLKVRCKLAESEIKEYTQDIQKFISDKLVTEILGKAFDINCESLDAKTLEDSWNRLQLKALPSKFNWQSITEQYFTQVQELLLDSKELHHILELQKLSDIETNTKEIAGVIVDFNLVKYQEGIRERYGNLKLDSLDTSGYAYNELKLWRIFIAQNVREDHQVLAQVHELPKEHLRRLRGSGQVEVEAEVELEELKRHKRVDFEQPILSVLDVVNKKQDYKYLVILGDPGSGKSTLLQFLALNWAESPLDNVISLPIPLLIELRTYMRRREDKECNNFLEFFHNCSGAIHHLNQLELDKKLKAGNALVMFDGLDEVFDPGKREDVITDIHRFTNEYPDVQVIVTSRIIGYKPQRLLNAGFRHFTLQDLDSEQIQDFINRWHELTFTDAVDKARNWKEHLDTLPTLKKLAFNSEDIVQYVAVVTLARNFKDDPNTLSWLKNDAMKHEGEINIQAAVEAVARYFKEDPETLLWLITTASKDEYDYTRYQAVEALARHFKKDSVTLPFLKQCAQNDDCWTVRCQALEELVKGWKDQSSMFEFFHDITLNDPFQRTKDEYIETNPRQTALEIIIKQYPQHHQTLPLLRDRAKNDLDEQVREYAQKKLAQLSNN
ncbi:HEAT repeat domain-containing protein [Nostoc sp.]|uniref:HEAT repeat domain-containing protein n=1 Tax=Nostoc sp. TaxID=1180 RepID=UPI002FFBE840